MDCRTAIKLIPVFLDGELADARALKEHLAGCTACSQELAAQQALMQAMGAWQGIESSRTYADFRVQVEGARNRRQRSWWQPVWSTVPRWAAAALIVMAFLGGGISGLYHSAQITPHSHVITADMELASESLDLNAFDGGLSDVVTADLAEVAK